MDYTLNAGVWNSVFAVPTSVVDDYIKLAGGNSLKLLLFLLRHGGKSFSEDELREKLGFNNDGEFEDAAVFWEQRGIIRRVYGDDSGELCAAKAKVPSVSESEIHQQTAPIAAKPQTAKPIAVSSGEIADRIKTDKEISLLFSEAENLFGRPLRQSESALVINLVDHYGLNVGVSLMLLNYCFKADKSTPNYILRCAQEWVDSGINTIELANARVLKLEQRDKLYERLKKEIGITTNLTKKITDYFDRWSEQWGFSEEMILHAYEITLDNTGSWQPKYTEKILESWKNDGIFTIAAADKASEDFKSSKNQKKSNSKPEKPSSDNNSSFDMNDIMAQIQNRYKNGS